jgi:hypothetical protein
MTPGRCRGVPKQLVDQWNLNPIHQEIVLVRCVTMDPSGPDELLAYRTDSAGRVTLQQVLVPLSAFWHPRYANSQEPTSRLIRADARSIVMRVAGYRRESTSLCCADVFATLRWQWNGHRWEQAAAVPDHRTY